MNCEYLVVGAGASGMMAGIAASSHAQGSVVVCEGMDRPGLKVLASGGKRCNLTNTLPADTFMTRFGRSGRFMAPALKVMGNEQLRNFFSGLGIPTDSPDGFRVWPSTHRSRTVVDGLVRELERKKVLIHTDTRIRNIERKPDGTFRITTDQNEYLADKVIIATGGRSYRSLGATGDGYTFAAETGHRVVEQFPAGVPLETAENWPSRLTAHTIGRATVRVATKKHRSITGTGDLIFTRTGIAGPVVLDMSGDISCLLNRYPEVPLVLALSGDKSKQDWQDILSAWKKDGLSTQKATALLSRHIPLELAAVLMELAGIEETRRLCDIAGVQRDRLINLLVETPITVTGTAGFENAFVTKGGVSLKDVNPETLMSKRVPGLYFCGEVLDLDGPCGGFNLQWAFASGYLAGSDHNC